MTATISALPILPGKLGAWRHFIEELPGVRRIGTDIYERRVGQTILRVWHQATVLGDLALVYQGGSDVGLLSTEHGVTPLDSHAAWNRRQMLDIHAIDLDQPPMPLPMLLFAPEGQSSQSTAPREPTIRGITQPIYPN
jgi:hypothetical protein